MFKVNDKIIYQGKGVCTVSSIEERNLNGETKLYYILKPISQQSTTVYLPADNGKLLSKIKKILTHDEADEIIMNIPLYETEWCDDVEERKKYYKSIIEEANRSKIIAAIRCIYKKQLSYESKGGKKPRIFDLAFMTENEKAILEELATALDISPDEAKEYIERKIG